MIVLERGRQHRSQEWEIITRLYKDRIWTFGTWAAGGLAVGLGVLPLIGGIASLVRPSGEPRDPQRTAFTIVAASRTGHLRLVRGDQGRVPLDRVLDRDRRAEPDLPRPAPLRRHRARARAARDALVVGARERRVRRSTSSRTCPYATAVQFPYYEGHGLAITAFANRIFHWPTGTIRDVAIAIAVAADGNRALAQVPAAQRARRRRRRSRPSARAVARLERDGRDLRGEGRVPPLAQPRPQLHAAVRLGRPAPPAAARPSSSASSSATPNGDLADASSGTRSITARLERRPDEPGATGPGPTLDTGPGEPRRDAVASRPDTKFALGVNGVAAAGAGRRDRPTGPPETVYALDGGPLRLASSQTGVEGDGWLTAPDRRRPRVLGLQPLRRGHRRDRDSRWSSSTGSATRARDVPGHVTVRLGTLVVGPDKQPALGRVLQTRP